MADERVQTFRERMPIVAKMINSALNGDAKPEDRVAFTLVVCRPDGSISAIKNMPDNVMIGAFLEIIAGKTISASNDDDDQVVGHA